jgi:chromosome segregation ATPase
MQTYQTDINRATQRTDDARSKLSEVQEAERRHTAEISRAEDSLRDAQGEADKKRLAGDIDRLKAGLTSFKAMEQDRITVLQQAEAQLQKAEDAFDTVQNELGQILKGH